MTTKDERITIPLPANHKNGTDKIDIIGQGTSAYLWMGLGNEFVCCVGGEKNLRQIANAILRALEPKKKK